MCRKVHSLHVLSSLRTQTTKHKNLNFCGLFPIRSRKTKGPPGLPTRQNQSSLGLWQASDTWYIWHRIQAAQRTHVLLTVNRSTWTAQRELTVSGTQTTVACGRREQHVQRAVKKVSGSSSDQFPSLHDHFDPAPRTGHSHNLRPRSRDREETFSAGDRMPVLQPGASEGGQFHELQLQTGRPDPTSRWCRRAEKPLAWLKNVEHLRAQCPSAGTNYIF